ncbi:MAG TPA: hypothetical protein VFH83_11145, partial [Spirochaetia bacterium]|nr:hypothetical protein [Spirochaetia bacterium]
MIDTSRLLAAFGEADITPSLGTNLAGWIVPLRPAQVVRDPIQAHIGVLQRGADSVAVIGLDILSISIADARDLRERVSRVSGVRAANVLVAASHSHTGPAVADLPITPSDRGYVEQMKAKIAGKAAELAGHLVPASIGHACGFEGKLSFNRRYIRQDGIVRTHPTPADPQMVCAEGPIDPQLGVLCVRNEHGAALGYLVNFACHPCFLGGLTIVSANYPGSMSRALKALEGPDCVTVFLNGACGDIHHANPV